MLAPGCETSACFRLFPAMFQSGSRRRMKTRCLDSLDDPLRRQRRCDLDDFNGDIDIELRRGVEMSDGARYGIGASAARHIRDFEFHLLAPIDK